ncbi:MAG: lipid-A-disaccharide synthase [Planctomycetota bacterium]
MRIFISVGEPSGDIHGASLIRELQSRHANVDIVGFGGDRMKAEGAKLLFPLVQLAVMGIVRVLSNITTFLSLLSRADRYFRHHRPDAVVLIDYPGFNWWIARRAKFHGIPVFYFVPPQLWAWAGWRVEKMRRFVDHVLCTLPFEKPWYEERGVEAQFVGHPFFDELPHQKLDAGFMAEQRARAGEVIALLPGSRDQEVERNLETLVRSAASLHRERPGTRFLIASFKAKQQAVVDAYLRNFPDLPIETHVGRTPEILELCKACVAVSGSVALEMLYRRKPSIIVYKANGLGLKITRPLMTTPFICLVNLLAGRELFPEFLTDRDESAAVAGHLQTLLTDDVKYRAIVAELGAICEKVAKPGACARAAEAVLQALEAPVALRRAG